jgi:sulfate transport system substrate-binding protein
VLVGWESDALHIVRTLGKGDVEIVTPPRSVLAEPAVAWVDRVVDAHGTRAVAEEYLSYLYSPEAQALAAAHGFRTERAGGFPPVQLFTVREVAGDWERAQKVHFDDGGVFDRIYEPGR